MYRDRVIPDTGIVVTCWGFSRLQTPKHKNLINTLRDFVLSEEIHFFIMVFVVLWQLKGHQGDLLGFVGINY
jgi:uncharacterized membrane protein